MATTENTQREEAREVKHVTLVGLVINILLGVAKIAAGVLGRSGAMVADGIHSFSDLASDVVVIVMVGASLPEETVAAIKKAIASTPGVITYHHLRTAKSGGDSIVDFHLKVSPEITVANAHDIATEAERAVKAVCASKNCFVNIHIEPYKGEEKSPDGSCR